MPDVPGLAIVPDWLGPGERHELLDAVDRDVWSDELRRRVQHHGWRYDYRRREVSPDDCLGPLPAHLAVVAGRLAAEGWTEQPYDQVIVNEYEPGQGIAAHIDCLPCFGPSVASVALTGSCEMVFDRPGTERQVPVHLGPGTLLVLRGPAREDWRHAIPARRSDAVGGRRVARTRRVSLTFRTVRAKGA